MSFLTSRMAVRLVNVTRASHSLRPLSTSSIRMASNPTLDAKKISEITELEKNLTGQDGPVKGGPTAQAQSHVGQPINADTISDITQGERKITGAEGPVKGGPASMLQSDITGNTTNTSATSSSLSDGHSGKLDSQTISAITDAEKQLTGKDNPVQGGPTAQAQSHAGQPINSDTLHDITEGEKKVTGGERVKGGPTATAQSELGKSRN